MFDLNSIYNVNCYEAIKEIPDGFFDLAIVDPPYGIGMDGAVGKSKKFKIKKWDGEAPPVEYFEQLKRVSKNQIIWGANHFIERVPGASGPGWVVWDKREGFIPERTYADAELAYTTFANPVRVFRHFWDGFLQKEKEARIHPTQKPVALYKWLLKRFAKPGDKILDTHVGSASSIIAFEELGFEYLGFELFPETFASAEARVKEYREFRKQQIPFAPQQITTPEIQQLNIFQ